ncbi:MAG: hypothetical protein J0M20_15220, partial [Burkholderiales bacterium]|nr:hypothetical protein [Burkholderiales bacterium]
NDVFALYYDLSLGESFQYLKEYWIIIVFLWLIFRQRQGQYMGWRRLWPAESPDLAALLGSL